MKKINLLSKFIFRHKLISISVVVFCALLLNFFVISCDNEVSQNIIGPVGTPDLTTTEVETLIARAVELADRMGATIAAVVVDREANVLGQFRMTGIGAGDPEITDPVTGAIAKARTAAYLSSNSHAFTSLTACFITRPHFPPGINNTPAGPLYGVPFSSLGGGDIQPNGGPCAACPGLTGVPGGVPIFKGGRLAGGIGISGGVLDFTLNLCQGSSEDEAIALGALADFSPPTELQGDQIFIDGIRFLYANAEKPDGNFTFTFGDALALGFVDGAVSGTPLQRFPIEGEVLLGGGFDFPVTAGALLTQADVQQIIGQAVTQANKTRAAIRRPLGSPARVFISVVDTNGTVLGIWRTPDATLFSFDVSAQKARTSLAFSRPDHPLGIRIRNILGVPSGQGLAVSCRAVGFLSQDFFPPGIDEEVLDRQIVPGPLYQGAEFLLQDSLDFDPYGNGITIFPGGCPLYKNGALAGAIGISGDGVDQDDIICFAGTKGFEPPSNIRCDNYFYDEIRLPYVKFPRRPENE